MRCAEIARTQTECSNLVDILDRVGNKWTIMVVGVLADGPMRFNQLQRRVRGISHRMLTLTLRALERDGLILRTANPEVPPRVEYQLTDLGRSLIEPMSALSKWAAAKKGEIDRARAVRCAGRGLGKASKINLSARAGGTLRLVELWCGAILPRVPSAPQERTGPRCPTTRSLMTSTARSLRSCRPTGACPPRRLPIRSAA
ncbi:winged helix-turn-helix transcriptional regulator [Arenibacterium sp. LLYu02]|uniref:winged helix-turn-helix transcriptional regulator n=1 Tax=Arenibacterium sp. LLYu02 TaxID=3404132 RepID=UPI003B21B51F